MQLQIIFDEISEMQKERREREENYKNALQNNLDYQKLVVEGQEIKAKKVAIENKLKNQMGTEFEKLENLKSDIKGSKDLMSDKALTMLMSKETVEVKDKDGNEYEPRWSVKFVKTGKVYNKETKKFEKNG